MFIKRLDHFVLTVENMELTLDFYMRVLGMKKETYGDERVCLKFGNQKINLHEIDIKVSLKAKNPRIGSSDLCFIVGTNLEEVYQELIEHGHEIVEGIIERQGANGLIQSLYIRDPDANLIELSQYI